MRTPFLTAKILDVEGMLRASPHERAWREALQGFNDSTQFTSELYHPAVTSRPRRSSALAASRVRVQSGPRPSHAAL